MIHLVQLRHYQLEVIAMAVVSPRVAPFLSKDSSFITTLKKELADHVVKVNLKHDVPDGMFTFYDSKVSTFQIYQVASVTFYLLLLLDLGSYLITLFSLLAITTRGLDDQISLFRRPPSRKAFVEFNRGRYSNSLDMYKRVSQVYPRCPAAIRLGIGLCHYMLGQFERAKQAFEHVLQTTLFNFFLHIIVSI